MPVLQIVLASPLAAQSPAESLPVPETAAEAAGRMYSDSLHAQMAASKSPRERAMAARSAFLDEPSDRGKSLRAAAQAAPGDPLVQMLWSSSGSQFSGCERTGPCPEQVFAWERAEPENGYARMIAFQAEGKTGDDAAIDVAIAHIADAPRYDDHVIEFWREFRRAVAARPMPAIVVANIRGKDARPLSEAAARAEANAIVPWRLARRCPCRSTSLCAPAGERIIRRCPPDVSRIARASAAGSSSPIPP